MGYIDDAFLQLKSNLEITQTEQDTAVQRHTGIRDYVTSRWDLIDDFLTGSYRRDTKTKKLKDIDIFIVIDPDGAQADYRTQSPVQVLNDLEVLLAERWPDAHRDGMAIAVLTALDHNARHHPNVFFVATSNFTTALDDAFLSRSDAAILVPLPSPEAVQQILQTTLLALSETYPGLRDLATSAALAVIAARATGLDGRRVRKVVFEALSRRLDTVMDPGMLTEHDLAAAAAAAVAAEQGLGDRKERTHAAA